MKPVIIIPARLNSQRLPLKPLRILGSKPLILHAYERALDTNIAPVFVACDSPEIQEVIGRAAILTRPEHPSGSDRILEALHTIDPDALYDTIINVQGDMPDLRPEEIRAALDALRYDIGTVAAEVPAGTNPNRVKLVASQNRALYFSRASIPHGAPTHLEHVGIYAFKRHALEGFVSSPPSPLEKFEKLEQLRALEAGMHIGVKLIARAPLCIDTAEDYACALIALGTPF